MNKLTVEISLVDTECMEDVEPPHFVSGLSGEGPISEKEKCFSRLMQSSPRVPSTLQLPAAESINDVTVFCLFSMHKPFHKTLPSLCRPLKTWPNRFEKHFDVNKFALLIYNEIVILS